MKTIEQLLATHPMFEQFDQSTRAVLAECGTNVHVADHEYLFRTGGEARHCYLLRRGRVAFELVGSGGQRMVIESVEPGDIVGTAFLVPPYRWHLDARAVGPIDVIALDAECLRRKCDANPRAGYLLLLWVTRAEHERLKSVRVQLLDVYGGALVR